MQIINTTSSNGSTALNTTVLAKSMDTTTKYLDSNVIKYIPSSHDVAFPCNSDTKKAIFVSSESMPLRQITQRSQLPLTSPVVSASFMNFQDVQSDNIVLIPTPNTLEQYHLQLYNYALSIERLRCPQYTTAAAMSAGSYANGATTDVHLFVNEENKTTFGSVEVETESSYPSAIAKVRSGRPFAPTTITHGNRLALSMSLFPQRIFHPEEPKPQYSYIGLIAMAILNSAETKLVLADIYQYILDHYPYFRARGPGWRNSIRHNLSLNDCFIKSGRSTNGKGHYWAIHPANIDDFRKGDFRRRKAQRKVRKHMGLSLDDAGTDSPSPPLLDLRSAPLTATNVLSLEPTRNSVPTPGFTIPHIPQSISCLSQINHPIFQMPSSLVSLPHHIQQQQQQFQDHYFGAAIMEQYTCIPPAASYNNRHSIDMQQQEDHHSSNNQFYTQLTNNNASQSRPQEELSDTNKNSKLSFINQAATTTSITPHSSTNAIAHLYSQTRKRQFDVASLLAPDCKHFVNKVTAKDQQITTLHHTILKKATQESGKECTQYLYNPIDSVQPGQQQFFTHSSSQNQIISSLELKENCEQEQDEIDVVANDNDEHSKHRLSSVGNNNDNDDDDPHDIALEKKQQKHTFDIATKISACSSTVAQICVDNESKFPNVDTALPKSADMLRNQQPLQNAVFEWHMLPRFPVNQQDMGDYCSTKFISATTLSIPTSTVRPSSLSSTIDNNSEENHSKLGNFHEDLDAHKQSSISKNNVTQRNQHVRRIIQHLHQKQQKQDINDDVGKLGNEKSQAYGLYYDTCMAAAAARHISSLQLASIQGQRHVKLQHEMQQKKAE
ncbi:unnamed protein product [Ceratitis capitata]|uniref:(Mediterranean fruit fly) hypothetical protein n=1 Tax=Ceratitis capitata TaxID=7213 RepID=A0A811UV40_CERCA|nr:unnamed protein product [Ceratitis capitata]